MAFRGARLVSAADKAPSGPSGAKRGSAGKELAPGEGWGFAAKFVIAAVGASSLGSSAEVMTPPLQKENIGLIITLITQWFSRRVRPQPNASLGITHITPITHFLA